MECSLCAAFGDVMILLTHTFIAMCILCLFPIYFYRKTLHPFVLILWGYFLLKAVWTAYSPLYYPDYAPTLQGLIAWNGAQNLVQLILIPIFVLWCDSKKLWSVLKYITAANLVYIIVTKRTMGAWYTGNTMDMALAIFFLFSWGHWLLYLLSIVALFVVGGATAYIMVAVKLLTLTKRWWKYTIPASLVLASVAVYLKPSLLWPSDRVRIWDYSMQWWWNEGNHFFGEGLGAFAWIGPVLGVANGKAPYMWAHNDWVQNTFDSGFIGLALMLTLFVWSALKARKNVVLLGQIFAYFICMMFYSPLRVIIGQIILCVFIKEVWLTKNPQTKNLG